MAKKQHIFLRKLIKEQLSKLIDYTGKYENLLEFINSNNLQSEFVKKYSKLNSGLTLKNWEDFVRGEIGSDEEIIESLLGNSYNVYYDNDTDIFIVTKKKTDKLKYEIVLSNNNDIIKTLENSGIHSEYEPRFAVISDNKTIGGSTYYIDDDNVYNFDIGILDKYQGHGILKHLINALVLDARELNADAIKAQVVNNMLFDYLTNIGFDGSIDGDIKYVYKDIRPKQESVLRKLIREELNSLIVNKSFNLTLEDLNYIFSTWDSSICDEDEKDLFNYISKFLKTDFSFDQQGNLLGIENFPEQITLYRLIRVENPEKINKSIFGIHWTLHKKNLYNDNFIGGIGLTFDNTDELYVIEAVFGKDQIDAVQTTIHHLSNEIENEITTYRNAKPEKYKITKLYKKDSKEPKKTQEQISENIKNKRTNSTMWYHGSKTKFDKFKLKQGTLFDANYTSPIFLTSNIEFAKYYAGHKTPHIYKIKVLTNNIMDFRSLPSSYDLLMYYEKGKINSNIDIQFYKIGKSLMKYIENKFPNDNVDRLYNNLLDGDYSSIEQIWVYHWLKLNNYDGAYVVESKDLNLLIFDESKIKIISKLELTSELPATM